MILLAEAVPTSTYKQKSVSIMKLARVPSLLTVFLLVFALVGCASLPPFGNEAEPDYELIPGDATCVFTPEELTSAYKKRSDYVAGPGRTGGGGDTPGGCKYSHVGSAAGDKVSPSVIWVGGLSYKDPWVVRRLDDSSFVDYVEKRGLFGYHHILRDGVTLDRAFVWEYYCPNDKPRRRGAICEKTPEAGIVVLSNSKSLILRDDVVWFIDAAEILKKKSADEMSTLLKLSRLAAKRPPK